MTFPYGSDGQILHPIWICWRLLIMLALCACTKHYYFGASTITLISSLIGSGSNLLCSGRDARLTGSTDSQDSARDVVPSVVPTCSSDPGNATLSYCMSPWSGGGWRQWQSCMGLQQVLPEELSSTMPTLSCLLVSEGKEPGLPIDV